MNTSDRKGDTAKGARAIANANARRWDREERKRKQLKGKTVHAVNCRCAFCRAGLT